MKTEQAEPRTKQSLLKIAACLLLLCAPLNACSAQSGQVETFYPGVRNAGENLQYTPEPLPAQDMILQAQAARARKVEVFFSARVRKLLPDDTRGIPHQQFLLELENGTTVKIAHDTNYAPVVPVYPGDIVSVKGEYIWNKLGGVVHWTHHSDTPAHEGGYIDFNGRRYQ